MSAEKKNVLLFGLGAIGGFYAFILGRNENVSLSVVARSNYESVKANGLRIESQNHGNQTVKIDQVLKSPSESRIKFDYIVCAHKAVNPDKIPPLFQTCVDAKTTFVIIQNGVGNEEPFRTLFPQNSILSCVTWVGATQTAPGLIKHTKSEDMQMGLFANPQVDGKVEQARLDTFAGLLRQGGTVFQVEGNIQVKRWEKVVWNAAWNPLTTLTDVDTQTWLHSSAEAEGMTRRLMREVIDVARRCEVPIGYELVDELMRKINSVPGIFSSMHTDSKEGRPLEVDVILGYPMKKAREFGMDLPTLTAVYAMTMAVNGRLQSKL
ncbi:2-dehydropantoate 2-reductase [Hortaea werneckii]|nr:2-dehydropantoate 2-reductase [Hortaea werneckii]KAI7355831.1 2-dehydropantoate 2-reductase [Hortaea werneckii]